MIIGVLFIAALLGAKRGMGTMLLYLGQGALGLPFIPGDILKIVLAAVLLPGGWWLKKRK